MKGSDLPKRFRAYIDRENLLDGVKTLVVGLSGGADSVCLFSLLSNISKEYGISLIPVHVHHGIRGEEADRDARFSCEVATAAGCSCVVCHVDVPNYAYECSISIEEAARELRYHELEEVCRERNAEAIALAHHRGDQAETVLMNLLRGSGPVGLVGMEPKRKNRIRPLLFASKKEILEYLQENNITYVEDSTNSDPAHTRNRIRSELLPLAEAIFPQAEAHIAALAGDMEKWYCHLQKDLPEIEALIEKDREFERREAMERELRVSISREIYFRMSEANQTMYLRAMLSQIVIGLKDISRKHYEQLDDLLKKKVPGRRADLPGGCFAVSTYDGIDLVMPAKTEEGASVDEKSEGTGADEPEKMSVPGMNIPVPGQVHLPKNSGFSSFTTELIDRDTFYKKKTDFFEEKDYTKYIDYDRIESGLLLRHPCEGDYLVIDGDGNRKKLNRFYIDGKVPREERASQEVIADGSHIVWALPDRISEYYKVTDKTKRILKITRDAI